MLKLGNKTIGNACLGDKQLSAVFLGDKLIWSAGIELKIVEKSNSLTPYLGTNAYFPLSRGDASFKTLPTDKKYFCLSKTNDAVNNATTNLYFAAGSYRVYSTYQSPYGYYCSITDRVANHQEGLYQYGSFANLTVEKKQCFFMILPPSLEQFNATQIFNLLTLNGTDFTNLEKLADGYAVKVGEFKVENNAIKGTKYGIVNLGSLTWRRNSGTIWKYSNITSLGSVQWGTSDIANIHCERYKTDYAATSPDKSISIFSAGGNVYLRISDSAFEDSPQGIEDIKKSLDGVYMIFELATPSGSKFADLTAKQVYELVVKPKAVYPNGLKFEMKKTAEMDLTNCVWEKIWNGGNTRACFKTNLSGVNLTTNIRTSNGFTIPTNFTPQWTGTTYIYTDGQGITYYNGAFYVFYDEYNNYTVEEFASLMSGVSLIYELASPVGIKGTKYGIVSLEWLASDDVGYQTESKRFIFFKKNFGDKIVSATSQIVNAYMDGYKTVSFSSCASADKQLAQYTSGYWYMTDFGFNGDRTAFKNSLKGKYLIFELATPDGSDYSDLTAKQMFDLINTDKFGVLANGKGFDGFKLIGNGISPTKYGMVDLGSLNWIKQNSGNFQVYVPNGKGATTTTSLFNGYCSKYITENQNNVEYHHTDKAIRGFYVNDSYPCQLAVYDTDFVDKTATEFKNSLNGVYLIYELATPLGTALNTLTAQEAYHHFKEYNLKKLKTDNIIKIGGFVK